MVSILPNLMTQSLSPVNASYIDRVLRVHGWTEPSESITKGPIAPLPIEAINSMYKHVGHPEGTPEHAALVAKHGFAYRTLLGEPNLSDKV